MSAPTRLFLTGLMLMSTMPVSGAERENARGAASGPELPSFAHLLRDSALSRQVIDEAVHQRLRWKWDPELGYVEHDYEVRGEGTALTPGTFLLPAGIDGSGIVATMQPNGARTAFMYVDKAPRINTYGDSFTHGDQVNDGETWQEYLAGHLREPIRNFGAGGYGVYQAYRRMVREEATDHAALYLILYIWGDDSYRTLMRGFWPRQVFPQWRGVLLLPKPTVEMDLETGRMVEKDTIFPTEESMYRLTDGNWIVDRFKDDLALQLVLYAGYPGFPGAGGHRQLIRELDKPTISRLAETLSFRFEWHEGADLHAQARALLDRYAQRATLYILDNARAFAARNGKKLFIVLGDPFRAFPQMIHGQTRYDREVLDYLIEHRVDYFDMNEAHLADFRKSNLSYDDYLKRYCVGGNGHYSPQGNHFFAYSIKEKIVKWLDPKPPTYRERAATTSDSKDYPFNGRLGTSERP